MTKGKLVYHPTAVIEEKTRRGPEWASVRLAYNQEMKPILDALEDKRIPNEIKSCLKNYLVVSLVSTIETYFKDIAKKNIDNWEMDISKVVQGEITIPLFAFEYISGGSLTRGSLVASNFNFANLSEVDGFFSKLLGIKCLDTIKELDRLDPSNYFPYAASLNKNWKSFIWMFKLRNRLVHDKQPIRLSEKQLKSLCNCTMNLLDAAQIVCNKDFNDDLQSRLAWLRKRQAIKDNRKNRKQK